MNFQKFLENYAKNRQLNGTIMVSQDGGLVASKSFGIADRVTNSMCFANTQYLIGSVTKQFTAVSLLRALHDNAIQSGLDDDNIPVLENKVYKKLNKPVSNYLPADHKIWAGQMPGWANVITPHQLLIHSSGVVNYTSLPGFKEFFLNRPDISVLVSSFKNMDLDFPAGSRHLYSNSGYLILGEIIQEITGQALDTYLDKSFFKPLNMTATFLPTKGTVHDLKKIDRYKNLARGYEIDITSENPVISEVEKYYDMQIPGAAGGMISAAPDLLLWNTALYSEKVLPDFLLKLMLRPHINVNNSADDAYGYGIEVMTNQTLGSIYWHGGGIDGYTARLVYIPSLKLSIICLSNVAKNLGKLEPEIAKIKKQLSPDLDSDEMYKILDEEVNKNFPVIVTNKDRYFTTEFTTNLIKDLSAVT